MQQTSLCSPATRSNAQSPQARLPKRGLAEGHYDIDNVAAFFADHPAEASCLQLVDDVLGQQDIEGVIRFSCLAASESKAVSLN